MTHPYRSKDGLLSSSDHETVRRWDERAEREARSREDWTSVLREMGVKLAHPDDGWVNRETRSFTRSWYPQFNDGPEEGDLIAFGCPPEGEHYQPWRKGKYTPGEVKSPESAGSGYRICRVTEVVRTQGVLAPRVVFRWEDTGVRVPPREPEPTLWHRTVRRFRR